MIRTARLCFDSPEDRWYCQTPTQKIHLPCGTSFALRIAGQYVGCRLEVSHDWYILTPSERFVLHPSEVYSIQIEL